MIMKSILTKITIIAFCASFFPSLATAGGFTGLRDIDFVYQRQCTSEATGFEVGLKTPHNNPDGCSHARILNMSCLINRDVYNNAVLIFLTAYSTGGQVDVFVKGCDSQGHAMVRAVKAKAPVPPAP
jgi:hypothetical protein